MNFRRIEDAVIKEWEVEMEGKSPQEMIKMAYTYFGANMTFACSLGAEDVVLFDMVSKVSPQIPVFYLDTDKHFAETYQTKRRLEEKYNHDIIEVKPELTLEEQAEQYGERLWKSNPDLCCSLRKVEPLTKILAGHQAWITGIRREQSPMRANARVIEWDAKFELVKINPLLLWTWEDVWSYIKKHDLPYNPLHDQNYPSIGCSVCTHAVLPGQDRRAGRWSGSGKIECGLHK